MSFEEEFDDIIREKSDELNFPFDEKNWDRAGAMIDAERKAAGARGFKKLYLPALAVLFIASVITVGITYKSTASPAAKAANVNENKTNGKKDLPATLAGNNSKTNDTYPDKQIAANTVDVKPGEQNTSFQNTDNVPAADKSHTNYTAQKSTTQPEAHAAANDIIKSAAPAIAAPATVKSETGILPAVKNSSAGAAQSQGYTTAARAPATGSNDEENSMAKNIPAQDPSTAVVNAEQSNDKRNDNNNFKPAAETTNNDTPGNNSHAALLQANEAIPVVEQLPLIPVYQTVPADAEVAQTPLTYLKRYDEDYYKNGAKPKIHFLNVELGGTYMLGWDTKAGRDGKGMDWFGGFNYGVYITRKISISAGLQAYSIQHIDQAFYTSKKVEYDFGSIASNTIITSNNLYYAAIPLKIYYALNKENQFGVGVNLGYMLNSQNTVETYNVQDNAKINDKSVKNSGVYQGTNSLNIMLSASYRVELKPRVHLTGEFIYGMSDIFNNTRTIKNNEQPTGIRLSLQYSLFDK